MFLLTLLVLLVESLTLKVSPQVQSAPGIVTFIIRVEPNSENREFCVGYGFEDEDELEYVRRSCLPHVGEGAPKLIQVRFTNIPSGSYKGFVELKRVGDVVVRRGNIPFKVVGGLNN